MLAAHKAFWVSRAIQVSIALVGAGMRILKRMPTMRKLVEQYDADQMGALLRPPARSRSCLPARYQRTSFTLGRPRKGVDVLRNIGCVENFDVDQSILNPGSLV